MNISASLLSDRSKENILKVAEHACSSPERLGELVNCVMSEDRKLSAYGSWCLMWAGRRHPRKIMPHLEKIFSLVEDDKVAGTVKRNIIGILESIEIPASLHGRVMNRCFAFMEDPATAVAIKAFSLTTLYNLSRHYPDIIPELRLLIEARMATETAAFRSRGKKILSALR